MEKVCAVIVTHNRKELLRECLESVLSQTRPPDHVLVVDNASTDGTREMLKEEFPQVEVLRLPENQGGAGGFHEGMKKAYEEGYDWIWVMDDDTLPTPGALRSLLEARKAFEEIKGYPPQFLGSAVEWQDGSPHRMTWTGFPWEKDFFRLASRGLLPTKGLAFVSLLVSREVVAKHGLPMRDFFIWLDDVEYVGRATHSSEEALAVLVVNSLVLHATPSNSHTFDGGPARIPRFFYEVRNRIWLIKLLPDAFLRLKHMAWLVLNTWRFLKIHGWRREAWFVVGKGLWAGLWGRPKG